MGYGARARAGAQGGARPQLLTPNARDSVDHDDLVGVPLLVHLYDERGVVEGRSWSDGVERRHPLIAQAGRSSDRLEAPVHVVDVESASLQLLVLIGVLASSHRNNHHYYHYYYYYYYFYYYYYYYYPHAAHDHRWLSVGGPVGGAFRNRPPQGRAGTGPPGGPWGQK